MTNKKERKAGIIKQDFIKLEAFALQNKVIHKQKKKPTNWDLFA